MAPPLKVYVAIAAAVVVSALPSWLGVSFLSSIFSSALLAGAVVVWVKTILEKHERHFCRDNVPESTVTSLLFLSRIANAYSSILTVKLCSG